LLAGLLLAVACSPALPVVPTETPAPQETSTSASPTRTPVAPSRTPSASATPASRLGLSEQDVRGKIIHYWHTWSGAASDTMRALVDDFNTSNPWKIIVVAVELNNLDDMNEQMEAAIQDNQLPNLVMGYHYQAQVWDALLSTADKPRQLVDWDAYIDDIQWGLTAQEKSDFYPVFWQYDVVPGRRLGFPAQRSAQLIFYNRGWARTLGFLSPPATPEEFQQQACAMARLNMQDDDRSNDLTGGWIISTDYPVMLGWIAAFGGQIVASEIGQGESPYQFDTPAVVEALTFLRQLYDSGCAWLSSSQYPEPEFAMRLGVFSSASLLDIPYQVQAWRTVEFVDDWTVLPFPTLDGKSVMPVYGPSYQLLPASPEQQLATWLFTRWLAQPEQQVRLVQATGALPLRRSMVKILEPYGKQNPQWAAAVDLLPFGKAEPALQTWRIVRWALSDAGSQLFRFYFTIDQTPGLASFLNETAAELHLESQVSPQPVLLAPTKEAEISPTPSPTSATTAISSLTPIPSATPR
jgi:ABC-type glycerol-3-phosphate transport system substrate-binding protein